MGSYQPVIEHLRVDAVWNGDLASPVSLDILIDVLAKSGSQLALIRNDHPSVVSATVASISRLTRDNEAEASLTSPTCRIPLDQELYGSPPPLSNTTLSPARWQHDDHVRDDLSTSVLTDTELRTIPDASQPNDKLNAVLEHQQQSAVNTAEIPLFSQTASLYEATSSRDSAFSPPPPPASTTLTIHKRSSLGPDTLRTANQHSPTKKKGECKDDDSLQSIRRRPVSLDKRPPWRPGGFEDTTPRGRKRLDSDVTKRRISQSAGPYQVSRGRTQHRQSSLPGRMQKTDKTSQKVPTDKRSNNVRTLPKDKKNKDIMQSGYRDTTVKITRYAEALNADERLEKWLEDRESEWPSTSSPRSNANPNDLADLRSPDFQEYSDPALSSSPTPSSRAALPWTTVRGIRGGGSVGPCTDLAEEVPTPTLVLDNGTIFVFFQSSSAGKASSARFRIIFHVYVKLEHQPSGCHLLALPGLPLQSGTTRGIFNLTVTERASAENDSFRAHEKVAYVDENLCPNPLQNDHLSRDFALDTPFSFSVLCFEACRVLEHSDFEVDSDVHTRCDWENLDGEGIIAEHSMICSIRLHPFLMWAEYIRFKLFLIGGPSGVLETNLMPGNRRIYLEGRPCDAEHELELSVTCPVADLQKAFTISWEQSLGVAPFEIWLPRISGRYRKKLDDIFDLPHGEGFSISPRPCRKARVYSMVAQEEFLKSSGQLFFFPENQHTQATIQHGLTKRSGQFYDELTADSPDSALSTPINRGRRTPIAHATSNLRPSNQARITQPNLLKYSLQNSRQGPVSHTQFGRIAMKLVKDDAPEAAQNAAASSFTQIITAVLRVFGWFIRCLTAPARLMKILILVWLCCRAFDQEKVVQVEKSFAMNVKEAWNRWGFEEVELQGDLTDWKHLLDKANQGVAKVVQDGHVGALSPMDTRADEVAEDVTDGSAAHEDVSKEQSESMDQATPVSDEMQEEPSKSEDLKAEGEKSLPLLDRIDRALGWKPPPVTR